MIIMIMIMIMIIIIIINVVVFIFIIIIIVIINVTSIMLLLFSETVKSLRIIVRDAYRDEVTVSQTGSLNKERIFSSNRRHR